MADVVVLPVATATVIGLLNLPSTAAITGLINANNYVVLNWLEKIIDEDDYAWLTEVQGVSWEADAKKQSLFEKAYSYAIFREIAQMLNLNTAGKGIIQTTGFAESKTSTLSQDELTKLKARFDEQALAVIEDYLTDAGKVLLDLYRRGKRTRIHVSVIKGEDGVTEWT